MRLEPIARGRIRSTSHTRRIDAAGMIVLASLAAAVFACFFLIGRAASPHARPAAATPPSVSPPAAAIPSRMSAAPAIALGVAGAPQATRTGNSPTVASSQVTSPPVAVVEAPTVDTAPELPAATTTPSAPAPAVRPSTGASTPADGAPKPKGEGETSFDSSG